MNKLIFTLLLLMPLLSYSQESKSQRDARIKAEQEAEARKKENAKAEISRPILRNKDNDGKDLGFAQSQLMFDRVKVAYNEKLVVVRQRFKSRGISFPTSQIYWRAFKNSKQLELWAFNTDSQRYILVHTYPICEVVGDLGPKRQEGDYQIPEGFYYISAFNPKSESYLSLKINYPNESDQILGKKTALGGDIYIFGKCETIGSLPMTDDWIKEIYLINMYAKENGQLEIPVHIFPVKLTTKNMNKLKTEYFKENTTLINFWSNLKEGYEYFEKNRLVPKFVVNPNNGQYILVNP